MQNQQFARLEKAMLNSTLLMLLCCSWQCSGQNPIEKKNPVSVKDSVSQQPIPPPTNAVKGKITFDWDAEKNKYFFTFHDAAGKVVKQMTQQQISELGEFRNLPLPRIMEESQIRSYDLRGFTPKQRQDTLKMLDLPPSVSPEKKAHTHWILYGAGGGLQDGMDYSGKYLVLMSAMTGIDSLSETPTFSKSIINVLNSSGQQIASVEQHHEIGAICLSDDARFLFMGIEDIHLDNTESYSTRKASLLYDLKEKKQYWLPVKFDINSVIGDADLRFQKGRCFSFSLCDQYCLHVLIDPYDHVIYTKEYPEMYSDFSNPDMGTYSRKTFK